jgi:hypothetical protein
MNGRLLRCSTDSEKVDRVSPFGKITKIEMRE